MKAAPRKNKSPRPQPVILKPLWLEGGIMNDKYRIGLLVLLTSMVYFICLFNKFTNWDDGGYVLSNKLIESLSFSNLKEIFKTPVLGNYHPLTILSYAVDYSLVKHEPFLYHLTSLLFHLVNSVLVYIFIRKIHDSGNIAFLTAALFAIHPLHVESVAWISERKDVMYTCFFLASLIQYVNFVRSGKALNYIFSIILFVLCLLSKGQGVSMALILFALDYYLKRPWKLSLITEKIPFLIISLGFGVLAVYVQHSFGYMSALKIHSLGERIVFAHYALILYLYKLVAPFQLANFYPFPQIKWWMYLMIPVVYLYLFLVYRAFSKKPHLVFGNLFFLFTIFLLLQLIPVGGAIISERYSYIPYIGLFFALSVEWTQRASSGKVPAKIYGSVNVLVIIVLSLLTLSRIPVWKDSISLWSDEIKKVNNSAIAYNNRATAYKELKKNDLALSDFNKAIELNPNYPEALTGRGEILRTMGRYDEALEDFNKSIRLNPKPDWTAYMGRGVVYCIKGRLDLAGKDFEKAFEQEKESPELFCNRGNYFDMLGQYEKALSDYSTSVKLNPNYANGYLSRGSAKARKNFLDEAEIDFKKAIEVKPDYGEAYFNLSYLYKSKKQFKLALENAQKARENDYQVNPDYIAELENLVRNGGQ